MPYREAQPQYLAAGWPSVLPLPARSKAPPPEGYTGRGAPDPDPDMLARWLIGFYAGGNTALRLPDGVVGIDVDAYGAKPGAASLASLEARLGPLPATWTSSARAWPSGIRLYRVPKGRAWRNPAPGIEIIHTGWRYAVVWPSIHPEGMAYGWTPNGTLPRPEDLPWLPDTWIAYLDAGELTAAVETDVVGSDWLQMLENPPYVGSCWRMRDSTQRHVLEIRAGAGRHDAMMRGQNAVIGLAADGHKGIGQALAELRGAFLEVTTDRSTWGEWDRALTGAIRKVGASTSFAAPPCRCDDVVVPAAEPEQPGPTPDVVATLYLSVSQLREIPRPVSLIDGVLDGSALFAVLGRSGIYKSFFALDWLCCLATGTPWLGHAVRPVKVLYVTGEGVFELNKRLHAWQIHHNKGIPDDWLTVRTAPVNLFKPDGNFTELLQRAHSYGVIVFDTLQRMSSGGDLNLARDAGPVIERLDRLRRLTNGGSVGYVGHTGKSDQSARGSSVLEDDVDLVWKLKQDEDSDVMASLTKRKDGPDGLEHKVRMHKVDGTDSIVLVQATGRAVMVKTPAHALAVLELLASPAGVDGFGATTLAQAVGVQGGAIYRPLNWLLEQQWVSRKQAGQRVSWLISPPGRSQLAKIANISP